MKTAEEWAKFIPEYRPGEVTTAWNSVVIRAIQKDVRDDLEADLKRLRGMLFDAVRLVADVNPGDHIFDNNFKRAPDGITDQVIYDRICEEVVDGNADWPSIDSSILGLRNKAAKLEAASKQATAKLKGYDRGDYGEQGDFSPGPVRDAIKLLEGVGSE